jgi:hypothetical protein
MALGGIIRRRDKRPLGSPEQVKAALLEVFPGTRFALMRDPGLPRPRGFSATALLIRLSEWMSRVRYPHWEGTFECGEFAAVFELDAEQTVTAVRVTLYGRGTPSATAYFSKLSEQTGWQTKF